MKTYALAILLALPLVAQSRDPFEPTPEVLAQVDANLVKGYREQIDSNGLFVNRSRFLLGMAYYNGKGVEKDFFQATKWLRESAIRGSVEGAFALGACYANGHGVPKDYIESYAWYNLAAIRGNEEASAKRDLVEKSLSPGGLETARAKSSKLYEEMTAILATKPTQPKSQKKNQSK